MMQNRKQIGTVEKEVPLVPRLANAATYTYHYLPGLWALL